MKHDLQHAERRKRLQFQWEWQSLNGRQSEVTSIHLTSELNPPPALFPRAQLNHMNVSELRDNSLFLYSRLTAPVDFNLTLSHGVQILRDCQRCQERRLSGSED